MKKLFIIIVLFAAACTPKPAQQAATDPLPSWNDGLSKQAIIAFVTSAVSIDSVGFIPVEERIATFDNDGTLWCEQPLYFEMVYSIDATAKLASTNTELQKRPEIKALVDGDKAAFMKYGEKGILEAFAISHTMVPPEQFDLSVDEWLELAIHPRFNQPYEKLTYKPMVELLEYLRANDFKTFIVSGGSAMFIRNFAGYTYGIPAEQVIGTMFRAAFAEEKISLKPDVWLVDDGPGKAEAIFNIIGRKPVLAFGNSDGDLEMLQYTASNTRANLCLYLHHTDAEREYAYDRESSVGKLDKGLTQAIERGWIVVDMKYDFNKIFSYE